tara:strand:- start:272 stop:904 length:633 start_codon:yes stop_codon:yes gene_type:complete
MLKKFFAIFISSFIFSIDSINAIEIKGSKKISDEIKIASLSDQYNKQESTKYTEINKCVEFSNSATYVNNETWAYKDYRSPVRIFVGTADDGTEIVAEVITFNFIELRGLQVFNRDNKEFPYSCIKGDIRPIGKQYGNTELQWEDDSKLNLMEFYVDEYGNVKKQWIATKCPYFLTNDQKDVYDDETISALKKKHEYICVDKYLYRGDVD